MKIAGKHNTEYVETRRIRLRGSQIGLYLIHRRILMQPITLSGSGVVKPHRVQIPVVSGTNSQATGDQRDDTSNVDRIAEFDDVEAT